MAQISEHINYSNHKIHSYYQIRKIIVNLGIKKDKKRQLLSPTDLYTELITN